MIRRPPRSTLSSSSAASDVYKRQFHACRACPAAPLIRLSSELIATNHPVRESTRALTKQRLLPTGSFSAGGSSVTTTNGSSAYVARNNSSAVEVENVPSVVRA